MALAENDIFANVAGKRVLEIGTGALAPLTLMCLRAGAREVRAHAHARTHARTRAHSFTNAPETVHGAFLSEVGKKPPPATT